MLQPAYPKFLDFKHTNTLIAGCIGYVLIESADGKIWAGTSEGLYCFDKKTDEIQRFTVNEGLPNNVICGICEDRQLNIWLSTYMGISRYDTREKHFVNYYASDGLQGNEFSHGAFCKAESGKMYFGGTNGVTGFLPQNISNVPKMPGVWIIGFYLSENPVCKNSLSGGKPIIDCAVQDAKNFQLSCQDNTFSIILSTMQYGNSEQISYQYKIDELNKRWQSTELGINRVTYNNLPPGKYTFSVRAVNRGIMSSVRKITIQIVPPWYQTRGAYCAYVLLIGLMAWGIANVFFTRIKHRREIMKREHAEQLNEAKLQFFINISHEIRTPMTLIINPLEKLLSAEKDGELHKTYQMIYRNAQRILRLINQLMDIRKLDKGQMLLKCQETDMVGFIKDVMQPFECLAREKKISFIFKHECPQLKTWIDLNNFDKVLMNILSNAFKYTPDGGEIEISLAEGRDAEREDALKNYFDIVIADTGIGINANEIEHIFERFYQVESNVTQSNFGTGIGLHLSRSLVELHHGIIFAENREDRQGCRFIIRLPLGSAHLRADELGKETGDASFVHTVKPVVEIGETLGTEQGNNKIVKAKTRQRILIAEDEEEIRNYLKSELEDEYHVQTCNNGKEAYELTLKEMPDLVISDVMMPEMDGLEFCRKVKHNTEINHIPIVLLTAKSRIEDTLEGMETGVDAYIVKPFNTDLLKSTIANLLGNRRLLRNKFNGSQKQEDKMEKIVLKSNDEILMERIMKVVNDHLDDPDFNVEAFALEVGMSRVHLHRKLKELTNLSARDFIKNIRLQQAAALLMQEKKLTISEVAYAVGYTSLSHFSNSFKEKYGVAPKEYIALHSV